MDNALPLFMVPLSWAELKVWRNLMVDFLSGNLETSGLRWTSRRKAVSASGFPTWASALSVFFQTCEVWCRCSIITAVMQAKDIRDTSKLRSIWLWWRLLSFYRKCSSSKDLQMRNHLKYFSTLFGEKPLCLSGLEGFRLTSTAWRWSDFFFKRYDFKSLTDSQISIWFCRSSHRGTSRSVFVFKPQWSFEPCAHFTKCGLFQKMEKV